MTKIYNCSDEVAPATFLSDLFNRKFYEVLVDHGVSHMADIIHCCQDLDRGGKISATEARALPLSGCRGSEGGGAEPFFIFPVSFGLADLNWH